MPIRLILVGALALCACAMHSPNTDAAPGGEPGRSAELRPSYPEDSPSVTDKFAANAKPPAAESGSPAKPSTEPAAPSGEPATPPPSPERSEPANPSGGPATPPPSGTAYPGKGFIVHEWGTNTVVSGSDGVLLRGLQHEGDDLPAFVFDRIKQGDLLGAPIIDKMETPVDYFYSDVPRSVTVRIDMPNGVFTQWFPAVAAFAPPIYSGIGPVPYVDPQTDVRVAYGSEQCRLKYTQPAPGVLDWGRVDILARDTTPVLPEAPLDRFTWSYARQVAANAVRVQNPMARSGEGINSMVLNTPQAERFLFYRGLGRFETPLVATSMMGVDGQEFVQARPNSGTLWLLRVEGDKAAFLRLPEGKVGYNSLLPSLADAQPLDVFADNLAGELTAALSGTGLYADEAAAMVNTWRQQWFRTQGVRLLYFAPQSWLDKELPLTITPAPDQITRVMVMRVELLTPSLEKADQTAALELSSATGSAAAREYFHALGRFAEPRLRRAMTLLGGRAPLEAQTLLTQIEGPNAGWTTGE